MGRNGAELLKGGQGRAAPRGERAGGLSGLPFVRALPCSCPPSTASLGAGPELPPCWRIDVCRLQCSASSDTDDGSLTCPRFLVTVLDIRSSLTQHLPCPHLSQAQQSCLESSRALCFKPVLVCGSYFRVLNVGLYPPDLEGILQLSLQGPFPSRLHLTGPPPVWHLDTLGFD